MEKFDAFRPDEETIESWIDRFEARLLCHNIHASDRKRNWCQALVGEAGRSIIKKLPSRATWEEIKQELFEVLGEANPEETAFDELTNYQPRDKGLGELATDIIAKASRATADARMQEKLGLKAFLKAIPETIGRELRRKRYKSVREALEEARFLERVEKEENGGKGKVLTVGTDEDTAVGTGKKEGVSRKDILDDCLKQLQDKGLLGERRERKGRQGRRKPKCWCCGEEGHMLMQCPTVVANRAAHQKAGQDSENE